MPQPAVVVDTASSPYARLRPVALSDVQLRDHFWQPRREINARTTIPSQHQLCERTGRIDNFRRASGRKKDLPFQGIYFNDSDVYKWAEAAAWTLAEGPHANLAELLDATVAEIAAAQRPDGYLNTYFTFDLAAERWTNLKDKHELYCAGHFVQAAVAHHRATGSGALLDVAVKFADHICDTFGPADQGKRPGTCGHEEVEMALVELYRATGRVRYLRQAQYFIEARGHGLVGGKDYHQDHKPFRDMEKMVGHAVRMVYLCCGAADVYAETGDAGLLQALERLWSSMTTRQMYITGGLGARYEGEAFGDRFELPNARAYAETCAAIASVMWNWRMLLITGDAKYADLIETTLYNAFLAGLSLDGRTYFYQNPLADDGRHRRTPWFDCACCPPNVARLLATLPGYFYSTSWDGLYVHQYATSRVRAALPNDRTIELSQEARYPWDGDIRLTLDTPGEYSLHLRIPGWVTGARAFVNAGPVTAPIVPGTYLEIRRTWSPGDRVDLYLPMEVRRMLCHPYVEGNFHQVAITRGPLVYCAEAVDNPTHDLPSTILPDDGEATPTLTPDLLGGIMSIQVQAEQEPAGKPWKGLLYRPLSSARPPEPDDGNPIVMIPYYAWANRDPGRMSVWLRRV
jgi:DUF1680 family protein